MSKDKKQKTDSVEITTWDTSEVTSILPGTGINITSSQGDGTGIPIINRIQATNYQFFDKSTQYGLSINPTTGAKFAKITMVGGGGAGGDNQVVNSSVSGGGGGGGATIIIYINNVQNYTFEIVVGDPNSTNIINLGNTLLTTFKSGVAINKFLAGAGGKGYGVDVSGSDPLDGTGGAAGAVDSTGVVDLTDITVINYNGTRGAFAFGSLGARGGNSSFCGGAGAVQNQAGINGVDNTGGGGSGCSSLLVGKGGLGAAGCILIEYY